MELFHCSPDENNKLLADWVGPLCKWWFFTPNPTKITPTSKLASYYKTRPKKFTNLKFQKKRIPKPTLTAITEKSVKITKNSGWWLNQPIWKNMFIKIKIFPPNRAANEKKWKHHLEEANKLKNLQKKENVLIHQFVFHQFTLKPPPKAIHNENPHTLKSSKNFSGSSEASALTRRFKGPNVGGGFCVPNLLAENKNRSSWIGKHYYTWILCIGMTFSKRFRGVIIDPDEQGEEKNENLFCPWNPKEKSCDNCWLF